jgi:hypothetical protein
MRRRALKQALLFAACGSVIYFFTLGSRLNGPWLNDIRRFYFHLFRILLGPTFLLTHDALYRLIFWMQWLPGAILGVGVWLIYRLTITPYIALVKDRRSQPTLRL